MGFPLESTRMFICKNNEVNYLCVKLHSYYSLAEEEIEEMLPEARLLELIEVVNMVMAMLLFMRMYG